MIHHTGEGYQTDISSSIYTRYYWKPNHMVYGKHCIPGCWQPTVCRQKSTYLAKALNAISFASDLSTEEARRMFEHSDAAGVTVSITKGQITMFVDGKLLTFDKTKFREFRSLLTKKGWLKDAPMSVDVLTSTSNKKGSKAKGTVKGNGGITSTSTTSYNAPGVDLKIYARPAYISHEFWNSASEYMRALMFYGLPSEEIDKFRAWDKRHWKKHKKNSLPERIKMFQKGITAPELIKSAKIRQTQSEFKNGLAESDLDEYRKWLKTEIKDGRATGVKEPVMIARFYARNVLRSEPKIVVFENTIELHDAHVIEMRRRRINRLKALRRVTVREGHDRFKRSVLANFDNCAITGLDCELEAAHIIPDATHEYMHPENGLALAGFLHKAFDGLLFAINPVDMTIFVAPAYRPYLNIHGLTLTDGKIWCISRSALAYHWSNFKEKNSLEGIV